MCTGGKCHKIDPRVKSDKTFSQLTTFFDSGVLECTNSLQDYVRIRCNLKDAFRGLLINIRDAHWKSMVYFPAEDGDNDKAVFMIIDSLESTFARLSKLEAIETLKKMPGMRSATIVLRGVANVYDDATGQPEVFSLY